MTRERIHKTVHSLSYQSCPYCGGRGKVRSPVTMSIFAFKELKKFLKGKNVKEVNLTLNPMVTDEVLKEKSNLKLVENRFRIKINLVSNPALHIEDIRIS